MIFLDWVNSGAPWRSRFWIGVDPVNLLVGWSGFEAAELLELQFSNPIRQVLHTDRANRRRQQ